jgi:hypothetical protein
MDQKRNQSRANASRKNETNPVKIKSSVVSPPEPTPHPKDMDSIEY